MGSIERRLVVSALLGVAVFVGFGIYADVQALGDSLSRFQVSTIAIALLLAAGNYAIRFVKWHYYLHRIGAGHVSVTRSLSVFLSGFAMSVTPGKLGELLKSYLLRTSSGVPITASAPVVLAERLTDFIALILLCLGGVASSAYGIEVVVVATALVIGFVALVSVRRVAVPLIELTHAVPGMRRVTPRLLQAYESMVLLVQPVPMLLAVALSVAAWGLECFAFHVVIGGFEGTSATLASSTFIYAFSTIAGAITMLPGGLIATEGSMIALLQEVFHVTNDKAVATAATLVVRFCTLWFAVIIGFVALAGLQRAMRTDPPLGQKTP